MNLSSGLTHSGLETKPASWVLEAARRPVAFAQVREDAALDQWVVEQLDAGAEVIMVASGGCSAAALATMPKVARLHLIDINPAQIALSRLKLRLLATTEKSERLSVLGHAPMSVAERRRRLAVELQALSLPPDALGPIDVVAEVGPDQAGRYEILFAKLREALSCAAEEITALLELRDPAEQSRRADPATPVGRTLDAAFDSVMGLPNLVGLFGEAATRNRGEPFSRHFARRTRHALATLPAADNPYLWQMLQGGFPQGVVYPWLSAAAPTRMPEVLWTVTGMAKALQGRTEAFDFVHLSNILDWLDPDTARATLDLVWSALRPGGWTLIRQLNSSLDIPMLGERFEWQDKAAAALHNGDRSFFYRGLYLGRKK
jgi:S-adenosylmethionine-diacylglycerol 3-amino-3-carboxypropyl transferase